MKFRDILAVAIALVAGIGLVMMWRGETFMVGEILPQTKAYTGMVNYLYGIGIILLGASVAYIMLGYEDKVTTTADDADEKK